MAEENTTIILVTQCLQNGFFLDAESRLALPTDEALRMLVGSPPEFEAELEDFEDTSLLTSMFKLTKQAEKDLFLKFVNEKRQETPPENPTEGGNGSQPPKKVESRRQLFRTPLQSFREFIDYRAEREKNNKNRRVIPQDLLVEGPLYRFLEAVTETNGQARSNPLHIINIRDWHQPSPEFDSERRRYGLHCEAGTWSAEPLEGFEDLLAPWATVEDDKKQQAEETAQSVEGFEKDGIIYYDIRSDSVFDFYPKYDEGSKSKKSGPKPTLLEEILNRLIASDRDQRVIMVMIGVYTDIKIRIMLTNLRSRYPVDNLIVSDVLTAAPSLERHLSALDFAVKVLDVEVMHSLNDLVQILNPQRGEVLIPKTLTQNSVNFREYQTYFLDKQNLLAYQEQKQLQYIELTKRRAARVYKVIFSTSRALMVLGLVFVGIASLAALFAVFFPSRATSTYLVSTGILGTAGLAQLMLILYNNPIKQLQKNLNNLVRLQTTVETQSLIQALTRYHVSRPERLYPKDPEREARELANLQEQINIITKASEVTSKQLANVDDSLVDMVTNSTDLIPSSSEGIPSAN